MLKYLLLVFIICLSGISITSKSNFDLPIHNSNENKHDIESIIQKETIGNYKCIIYIEALHIFIIFNNTFR